MTLSDAQRRANAKWDAEHKERLAYTNHRSRTIRFIESDKYENTQPDYFKDLQEISSLLNRKISELKNGKHS